MSVEVLISLVSVVIGFAASQIADLLRERRAFERDARVWRRDIKRQAIWRLQELSLDATIVMSYHDKPNSAPVSPFSGRRLSEEDVPNLVAEFAVWAARVGDDELEQLFKRYAFDFGQSFATTDPEERERRRTRLQDNGRAIVDRCAVVLRQD